MPSPPTKSIASYFIKPVASTSSPKRAASSSPKANSSKPLPDPATSPDPLEPPVKKAKTLTGSAATSTSFPSLQSYLNTYGFSALSGVAPVFAKTLPHATSKLSIPKATSRAELRASIKEQAEVFPLLQLELETMGEDWLLALQDEITKPYFLSVRLENDIAVKRLTGSQLKEFIVEEQKTKKVFPPGEHAASSLNPVMLTQTTAKDIYSWSRLCHLKDVRVVIIGQDPYHDDGQAHGLAFSVVAPMKPPPSLRNIYKQMATDIDGFVAPIHGDLTEWAKHGVLLLNTSLSVRAHEAGSHSKRGWEQFTAAVLKVVVDRQSPESAGRGVCFMAWGAHAAKMIAGTDEKKHLILRSAHPSPLSASRGFLGNGHFKKSNEWLEQRYGDKGGIDWKSLGGAK
ncbi:uracil-DNA glycosylase, partial [Tremellales sp. Uapishka_1]